VYSIDVNQLSNRISSRISRFLDPNLVLQIWEIGSRDGEDAKLLSETFLQSKIFAFEPNPDTFHKVQKISDSSKGRIAAQNIALSDIDGNVKFYKIDTDATLTSWDDGNPGASSLYKANGEYPIEKYVQIEISVKSRTAKSLIEQDRYIVPNLLWIDVQGAEGLVFRGFGEYLSDVDFIFVELSLRPAYTGQFLAKEIIDFLGKNFYWHSNLTTGTWQFDALLINKRYMSLDLKIRHFFLVLSLKSNFGIFIKGGLFRLIIKYVLQKILTKRLMERIKIWYRTHS